MPRSTALLVGIADYANMSKLANSGNDANDLAIALEGCGFDTNVCVDATMEEVDQAFETFIDGIEEGDVALFFFAGHGVQIDGENFLMAKNSASSSVGAARYSSLALNRVIQEMSQKNGATTLIILDACRDNPWAANRRGGGNGLAPVFAPKGTLIAFSTSPGEQASDGGAGVSNGAYTAALLSHISTADLPVEQMFKRVRNSLAASTLGGQTSWEHTSLSGEFYFALGVAQRITEYGAIALKDGVFVPDLSNWLHTLIAGLKSYTWSLQNAAIDRFEVAQANLCSTEDLFILGRNILQASNGNANSATSFIQYFIARTAGMEASRRKALLDGILFEIFFDSKGDFRQVIKSRRFVIVFDLQRYQEFATSFTFISNALTPFASKFLTRPPGQAHAVALDIRLQDDPINSVSGVLFGGREQLRLSDEYYAGDDRVYRNVSLHDFENEIAQMLLVPRQDLTLTYICPNVPDIIKFPVGYTVSPPGLDN